MRPTQALYVQWACVLQSFIKANSILNRQHTMYMPLQQYIRSRHQLKMMTLLVCNTVGGLGACMKLGTTCSQACKQLWEWTEDFCKPASLRHTQVSCPKP